MDIEAKHRALDLEIAQEQKRRTPNLQRLKQLKVEKLHLKDQMVAKSTFADYAS